ncbi:MAG: bifunctional 23S rRNA (guanine(2069)-N(7))-methyltransferase RlmK/23S rRNA (guanine(2445)-N(2))-methyltransferase RlmL [Desulfobulbaceae bacterium]|nr:bifunctional 23S rRNA (guanine(2069)-N(7))-methyltransferase RlmK/23S rRNA (guanine(2445)-N(2))-methyltransferase RlmL [Desulfobulbaceae bacterium]
MSSQVRAKKKKKTSLVYVATCGAGLENLVADEIKEHGGTVTGTKPGAVSWEGNLEAGYRLCLWSRFASRILLQIAEFAAPDPDILYRETGKLDWAEHLDPGKTFAVYCTLSESKITHSQYAALRIKDAIVDQFRSRTGRRPTVDVMHPGMRINLHVQGDRATLALDLSGDSLHRRGYRVAGVEAPMKETLAAAVVHLSGWTAEFSPDAVLLDPMCGSGTLLIEAAMIYGDTASGLQRKTFGFMYWPKHDARLWEKIVNEALAREERGLEKEWPRIIGYDADPNAVAAARKNIEQAGLEDKIEVGQRQLADLARPAESGLVLVNPPYGERLSEREQVKYLYRCLGRKFCHDFYGWQVGFFASNPDFSSILGINWAATIKLFNGPIKCKLHHGIAEQKQEEPGFIPRVHDIAPGPEEEDFANRLRKNCTALFPWAEQEVLTCFRIYDADIPDYNFAVDLYEEWVHVREYAPPKAIDRKEAGRRLQAGLQVIRELLGIPPSRVFIKTGQKPAGKNQPRSKNHAGKLSEVRENSCRFLVNFTDYPDTGLPLDQREIRAMIGRLAPGKKFLNLFGSTGTATINALAGGAIATTTVDGSAALLQRAGLNISLNGYGGPQHIIVLQDCLNWLQKSGGRYGLILAAPPSFSSDPRRKTTFKLQDDHEKLLRLAMNRLSREGLLIFLSGSRKFRLSPAVSKEFDVREITGATVPRDFGKNRPPHRCWEFRHPESVLS